MKRVILAVICAVFVFGTIATGYAEQGDWRGGIRSRIQESKKKIEQGIDRGTLNRHEADKLNAELGTILNKIDRMKADGYLSQGERDNIKNDLDRLDRDIFKEKHDNVNVSTVPAVQVDWRGGIRSRIQASKQRIEQGIEQGTLNRREARKLNKELGRILYKIDRMKSDGRISQGERDRIKRDLNRLDRDIFKEKRDDYRRR
jgi:ribosomal protein S20